MRKNWFENILYKRLYDKPVDLDMDAMWEDIERRRYPDKKERTIWLPFMALFLGMVLLGAFVFWNIDKDDIQYSDIQSVSIDRLALKETAETVENDEGVGSMKEVQTVAKQNERRIGNNDDFADEAQEVRRNTSIEQVGSITNSDRIPVGDINLSNEKTIQGTTATWASNIHPGGSTDYSVSGIETPTNLIVSTESNVDDVLEPIELIAGLYNIGTVEIQAFPLMHRDYYAKQAAVAPRRVIPGARSTEHILGISAAYGTMSASYDTVVDSIGSPLNTGRPIQNEQNLDYFDLGFDYIWHFHPKMFLQSGLFFQQYTSSYNYDYTEITSMIVTDTIEIHIPAAGGDPVYLLGDVSQSRSIFTRNTKYLKYRSIRIPVLLGTRINLNDSFSISAAGGLSFGAVFLNEGSFLTDDPAIPVFQSLDSGEYRSSNQWDGILRLDVQKSLNQDTYVSFGTKLNYDLTNRTTNTSVTNHRLSSFNLTVGLYKKF